MTRADHLVRRFQTTMGNSWWWRRYADMLDRRNEDGTYKPFDFDMANKLLGSRPLERKPIVIKQPGSVKPEMVRRPEGMTRQAQRRLYRESCKLAGVPWREERTFYTPRRERGRNWKDLPPEEAAKLEAQWQAYMENSVKIE